MGGDVVDGKADVLGDLRVDVAEFVLAEVVEFGGQFDTRGSAADDGDVEEFLGSFGGYVR